MLRAVRTSHSRHPNTYSCASCFAPQLMIEIENFMSDFVHLHCHSEYSLLDGLSQVEDLVAYAKELGFDALALTDHGAMYGAIKFYLQAQKAGIKPIIGMEAYMAPRSRHDKQSDLDRENFHLLLLAKNETGYRNLMKLTSIAHLEGFYYKPRIDKELLRTYSEGLIATSACINGEVAKFLLTNQPEKARRVAKEYAEIFGEGNYYIELQKHPNLAIQDKANALLVELARELGLPLVATNDSHYLRADDAEAHEILLCIGTQHTMLEKDRPLSMIDSPDFYLKSEEEMKTLFAQYPEAIKNTRKIADMCNLEISIGKWILPQFEVPEGETPATFLTKLVYEGAARRYPEITDAIKERIEYELMIITKKKYETYFLIVSDFVNWAKEHEISVGPGRGSAAGSVVSYAVGITDVDPLYFGLPFERFLNPNRPTPPDIDLDFADTGRDEVIRYVTQKYGDDRVAQLITFGTMEARAAVRDVGRALGMPYAQPDRIAKIIPIGAQGSKMSIDKALELSPELKAAYDTEEDTKRLLDIAKKLEGVARHSSVHAAGVVIADKTITDYTPVQREARGDKVITQYDMYTAGEDGVGLLKMDFLGLRNLTIIEEAMRFIKQNRGDVIDFSAVPLDDPATYQLLSIGQTTGIFQLESPGMRRYIKELKPTSIFDLMAMVALYRPGPMANIPEFIARKHNPTLIKYPDPRLKDVLAQSYGILTYQDDVLLTSIAIAGYTWLEADKLRKAVGKKIASEMQKQREKFIKGCVDNGMLKKKAEEMFDLIQPFAGYGFGKAHAACYATIAFRTAYLKAHYPVEFMTALLTAESRGTSGPMREVKIAQAVDECRRMNITILPPNINKSEIEFAIEDHNIRFGLSAVKNVGGAAIETILASRNASGPFASLTDFCTRVDLSKVNKKTMESLIKTGAFDAYGARAALLLAYPDIAAGEKKKKKEESAGQSSLFDMGFGQESDTSSMKLMDKLPEVEEFGKQELLSFEKLLLGFYLSEHPLTPVLAKINLKITCSISELSAEHVKKTVILGGMLVEVKRIFTRNGNQEMAFVRLEDTGGEIELVVFPKTYAMTKNNWRTDQIVLVKGKVDERDDRLTMIVDDIKPFG